MTKNLLFTLFDDCVDGFLVLSLDYEIQYCNDSFKSIFDVLYPDLIGKTLSEILPNLFSILNNEYNLSQVNNNIIVFNYDLPDLFPTKTIKIKAINEDGNISITCKSINQDANDTEKRFQTLFEQTPLGYQSLNSDGMFIEVNQKWLDILGYNKDEVIGKWFGNFLIPEQIELFRERFPQFKEIGEVQNIEFDMVHKNGSIIKTSFNGKIRKDQKGNFKQTHCVFRDITVQKKQEQENILTFFISKISSENKNLKDFIKNLLDYFNRVLDFEAVGIRLKRDFDYPYYEYIGFSDDFLEKENYLCDYNEDGSPKRDTFGNPILECMCGNILCGRFDPSKPFFTKKGSFWSNCTTDLLASTTDEDRQTKTRNRCNSTGYESVGLFPLYIGNTTLGLLQLNDKRKNRFSPDFIELIEKISLSISLEITHKISYEQLQEYQSLINSFLEYSPIYIFFKDDKLRALLLSKNFEKMLGRSIEELIGKTSDEFLPSDFANKVIKDDTKVLKEGKVYEDIEKMNNRIYKTIKFPILKNGQPNYIAGFNIDITELKAAEEALINKTQELERFFNIVLDLFCIADLNGHFLKVNRQFENVLGYTVKELEGSNFMSYVHPDDLDATYNAVKELSEEKEVINFINRYKTKTGTYRYLEWCSKPYENKYIYTAARDITERKIMEDAIKISEIRYRGLFDRINSSVAVYEAIDEGENFIFKDFNLAAEKSDNINKEDLLNKKVTDVFPSVIEFGLFDVLKKVFKTGETIHYPLCFYKDNRIEGWKDNHVYKLPSGEVVAVYQDVTEKKKIEQALQESESNFRMLFENMTNAFALHEIICDENNIPCNYLFLQVNPAFEKLTGLKAEDIVGKTVLDALPGTEKYWIDTYGKVALTGEPILMENYHSGLNKYYEVLSFSPKHKQFAVIFSDITKRKLIEIEKEQLINDLTISQNKYKVLFDNMTNAFSLHEIIYDENNIPYNFRFLEVNPAYERITNSKATDVLQKTALDFSTPKEMIELCIKVALTGIPEQFENYSVEFNKYYELLVFSPKHNQFAVIFSDVTERKQSELEREKLIRELELKNEELERFTYTVSHDLKSPLITIKGFLGLIQRDFQEGNTENIEDDINRINNAADKMQQLLEDLLELSRIGRILNPFSSFSMSDVIKDVEEQLQTSLNEKNITFVYDKNMPSISADKNRINELWQNLIENSIKYMDNKEKPEIKIGCIDDVYYIKDNGLGIESCYFEKIFGLFEKLNQKSKGTGIGLALVKRIIEFHGGKIWVESGGIGKGTAFYFTLR